MEKEVKRKILAKIEEDPRKKERTMKKLPHQKKTRVYEKSYLKEMRMRRTKEVTR